MFKTIDAKREDLKSMMKYAGTSLTLAGALTEILVFSQPTWETIQAPISLLAAFIINALLVVWWK